MSKLWYGCAVGYDRLQVVPYLDGAGEEICFEYMCAGIGQDVVLSIPSGWCDVAADMVTYDMDM